MERNSMSFIGYHFEGIMNTALEKLFTDFDEIDEIEIIREAVLAEKCEIERIYALQDRWLAAYLVRLGQKVYEDRMRRDRSSLTLPNQRLLFSVIPELARRVGHVFRVGQVRSDMLVTATSEELRRYTGYVLDNMSRFDLTGDAEFTVPDAVSVLCRDVVRGSPVAMLLDRVAPPMMSSTDFLARRIIEAREIRHLAPGASWDPSMN